MLLERMSNLELNEKSYLPGDSASDSTEENKDIENGAMNDMVNDSSENHSEEPEQNSPEAESDTSGGLSDVLDESNCTTDEDDIAYVAERITGARHSVVSTAAPIRTRENRDTMQMNSLVRMMENHAEKKSAPKKTMKKRKRALYVSTAAAIVLVVLLSSVIIGVNLVSAKNRPADLNIGDISGDTEILNGTPKPSESENNTVPESESESETEKSKTDVNDSNETEAETTPETDDHVETQAETEPDVEKFNVSLDFYDREDIEISTERITLSELLELCGVTLAEGEVPSLSLDSLIAADTVITFDKYEYKTECITETIAYESVVTETDLIPRGEKVYSQYGEDGQVNKYYTVEYKNGVENSRTYSYEETVKSPVNAVYEEGVGGSFVGSDGLTYTYSYRKVVPATYYSIEGPTYLGTMADESVIAVDMNNIPLGTKLYVKNDRYDFGVRVASDIGGQVDEWEIDVWLSKDNYQYSAFSREGYIYDMEIYYID